MELSLQNQNVTQVGYTPVSHLCNFHFNYIFEQKFQSNINCEDDEYDDVCVDIFMFAFVESWMYDCFLHFFQLNKNNFGE